MTVYVELVLLQNFAIDFFILRATEKLSCTKAKRIVLASVFGALSALVSPLIKVDFIIKLLLLECMLAICFGIGKKLIIQSIYALLCSCAINGIITFFIPAVPQNTVSQILVSAVATAVAVILSKGCILLARKRHIRKVSATLILADRELNAIVDSGNSLYFKDKPVIIVSADSVDAKDKIPVIVKYQTVSGAGALIGFEQDGVRAKIGEREITFDCVIAISQKKDFSGAKALIHPDLIGEFA